MNGSKMVMVDNTNGSGSNVVKIDVTTPAGATTTKNFFATAGQTAFNNANAEDNIKWRVELKDGSISVTPNYKKRDLVSDNSLGYNAGTKAEAVTTLPSGSGNFHISVVMTTKGSQPYSKFNFEAVGMADETAAAAEIASQISAREDVPFTASASGADLTITAKEHGESFSIGASEEAAGASTSYTAMVPPTGTPNHVKELEEEWYTYEGGTGGKVKAYFPSRELQAEAGETYDLRVLSFEKKRKDTSRMVGNVTEFFKLILAKAKS